MRCEVSRGRSECQIVQVTLRKKKKILVTALTICEMEIVVVYLIEFMRDGRCQCSEQIANLKLKID